MPDERETEQEGSGVEFLDAEGPDADAEGEVQWLDEEGVGSGHDGVLPPHAARGRVLASLLALALFLAGVGASATAAYHRHLTDRLIAGELVLRPSASAPSIPALAALGFAAGWHAQVTERVLVPVVNLSPRPVRLLDAVLNERGLVSAARLTATAAGPLAPGATGQLAGRVTVDCTLPLSAVAVSALEFGSSTLTTVEAPRLQVRARTSGGTTATALLDPENANSDLQQRICVQEGDDVTRPEKLSTATDPHAHTVTIGLSTSSNADVALDYASAVQYSAESAAKVPGLSFSRPVARGPAAGILQPGAALSVAYVIDVRSCPTQALPNSDELQLQVEFSVRGMMLTRLIDGIGLEQLLAAACGLDPNSLRRGVS